MLLPIMLFLAIATVASSGALEAAAIQTDPRDGGRSDEDTTRRSLSRRDRPVESYNGVTGVACRKDDDGDRGEEGRGGDFRRIYWTSFPWCMDECSRLGDRCQAFEYNDKYYACELWTRFYGFYEELRGFYCFNKADLRPTSQPVTDAPTTPSPVAPTLAPITSEPTTLEPSAPEPTNPEPTPEPTTPEPSTAEPTTLVPTTPQPTTTPGATAPPTESVAPSGPPAVTDEPTENMFPVPPP